MSNRDEVASYLEKLGYAATAIDGIVQITVPKPLQEGEVQRLERHLHDIGYKSSWGWKVVPTQ